MILELLYHFVEFTLVMIERVKCPSDLLRPTPRMIAVRVQAAW